MTETVKQTQLATLDDQELSPSFVKIEKSLTDFGFFSASSKKIKNINSQKRRINTQAFHNAYGATPELIHHQKLVLHLPN